MHRTNIYLDTEQIALLDRPASSEGVSRAQVIRQLLDRALQGSSAPYVAPLAADLSAIDATYGAPPRLRGRTGQGRCAGRSPVRPVGHAVILLDTDVLIAHLRGRPEARGWLRGLREQGQLLAVSVVTITELTGGMRSAERPAVASLLGVLRPEPVTEVIARRAGELMRHYRRRHTGIGVADYLIAATAEIRGADLATLNVRHFPMIPRLRPAYAAPSQGAGEGTGPAGT